MTTSFFYGKIIMMKNVLKIVLCVFSLLLAFISCSNAPDTKILNNNTESLRDIIIEKESTVNWSKAIDEERLSQKIDSVKGISNSVSLSPDVIKAFTNTCTPVYPYLENFESLDDTEIKKAWKEMVSQLINILNKDRTECPDTLFNYSYIYNYIFFVKDFENSWEENFEESIDKENPIQKYVIGKPFVSEDIIQLPVRAYTEKGSVDMNIFANNDGKCLINQIEIVRWDRTYGK